jgi:hypothetical protein
MKYLLLSFALLTAQFTMAQNVFGLFKKYIVGNFDNSAQVVDEVAVGKQIHPLAIHVNRVADEKILNKPKSLKGFFLLEESYYLKPGKDWELKPYLFYFEPGTVANTVQLTVYQIPANISKDSLRNDNQSLRFNYDSLKTSTTFKGATYTFNAKQKTFSTNAPNELPNGMRFTLIETFSADTLSVMELLEKDGKSLTPYTTPIIYKRKK